MIKHRLERWAYQQLVRPVFFRLDPELIHHQITQIGEGAENIGELTRFLFSYQNGKLVKKVLGVEFVNPVGLAAGFDYDGHLAKTLGNVGFGFNSVGTVTARPYTGNDRPMLVRLSKSQSLLVNKGFKSEGAEAVARRLDKKDLRNQVVGISVGSSNVPEITSIRKAIDDYLLTFSVFKDKKYCRYFELNISCPNTAMTESFQEFTNFKKLVEAVAKLHLKQPLFVKMPNEISPDESDNLVRRAMAAGIRGFIFSNLVKKRDNPAFNRQEIQRLKYLRGNFSGKPTADNAKSLLLHTRKKFGKEVAIISAGGIFTPEDAWERFNLGADLVQLITGMIFEGPQLAGEINEYIASH